MKKYHIIENIGFSEKEMSLTIDGKRHEFRIEDISAKIANATPIERNKFKVSPSGYGIHWPLIDEDMSIDGLLGIKHYPEKKKLAVSAR